MDASCGPDILATASGPPGDEVDGSPPAFPEAKPAIVPLERRRLKEGFEIIARDESVLVDDSAPTPGLNSIIA